MDDQLERLLDKIETMVPTLNAATDIANDRIARVGKRLGGLGVGVSTFIELWKKPSRTEFGYGRVDGKFQLYIWDEGGDAGPIPCMEAPRECKIAAALVLPGLLEQIIEKAEWMTQSANRLIATDE